MAHICLLIFKVLYKVVHVVHNAVVNIFVSTMQNVGLKSFKTVSLLYMGEHPYTWLFRQLQKSYGEINDFHV